ncbi:hypothetical protein EHQ92_03115 [Leptospira biflexa]|jgi:uncharacterized coiled-coil DUF342 family protein|uniref:hypothetical protein n=1 Tax=Leptospira biflexa TaxID=172 RepID=UPI001083BFB1|nr:hypothetical protein [Leptospira biflexa]TGM37395.1 hypothetical protein EHQ80_07265 [Leptospira biflexa]TGM40732.1 hypothetical protein EHQ89_01830 [Leptospira biflexa]TGM46936.1 hypothetical protein EHQ92_03115 [Leptospira biflexa]TGM50598.1 hypothetical protein EHQ88_09970 [Leptospira biflexa]TGM55872.1 hypothetical protein EHQ91_13350 [Leptospira biflexa]
MDENIVELNITIGGISKELLDVQKALDAYRDKQARKEAVDEEAITFVTKAERVIEKAEAGELQLTTDQVRRIKSNLIKILNRLNP